ncbi:STAS domain-containing protein [Actinoplanes sp. CA-131856]
MLELVCDVLRYCPGDVVVDLTALTFIDVAGLRALAGTAAKLRDDGRHLAIAGCSMPIARLIVTLGWEDLLAAPPFSPPKQASSTEPMRTDAAVQGHDGDGRGRQQVPADRDEQQRHGAGGERRNDTRQPVRK